MQKKLIKIFRIKMALIAFVFILFILALQTPWVKRIASKKLIEQLSEITHSKVNIHHHEGILPISFDLYNVSLEYEGKTWLTIERLGLNRSLLLWFLWKKKSMNLSVHKATLYSIPNFNPSSKITDFKWPKLAYPSVAIKIHGTKINIKEGVFDEKIPPDLSTYLNFKFNRYGKVFALKGKFGSDTLKHASLKATLRGHQKQSLVHASLELDDPKHELGPFYFLTTFPAFKGKINLSGSPDAFIAFFNPEKQTDKTFRGSFSVSAFPSVEDNDILSCLLNKKELYIDSEMNFSNEDGLLFSHFDLKGEEMLFNGQLALSRDYQFHRSYLEGEVRCLNFSQHWLDKAFEGKIRSYFNLLGYYKNPKIVGEIAADTLAYKQFIAYQFLSSFEYEHDEKSYTGELTLNANLNQSPLHFSTKYDFQNLDYFDLENLTFNYGVNTLSTPFLKKRKEIYQSTLNFKLDQMALFSSFLQREIHGDLEGKAILDIDLSPSGTLQIIDTSISGSLFQVHKVNLNDFSININGILPWENLKKFQGEIDGSCGLFKYKQFSWDYLQAYFNLKKDHITYKFQADGEASILSSGDLTQQEKNWKLEMRQLYGYLQSHPYTLINESQIEFSKENISFTPILMKVGMGQLYISKDDSKDTAAIDLKKFPINSLSVFIPKFDATGNVNLEGHFNNVSSETYGTLSVEFDKLRVEEHPSNNTYRGEMNAVLDKKFLNGVINLAENDQELTALSFDLPLTLSLYPWEFDFSLEKKAKVDFNYKGWVNPFIQMVLPENHLLEGYANIDLKLKGPFKEPNINGFFYFHKGYYENLFLGLVLNEMEAQAESSGHTLKLKRFTASDGGKGEVKARGEVALSLRKHLPYELNLSLNNGQVIQFDFLSASFLGDVKLKGNLKSSHLVGDVQITQAGVNIPSNLGKGLPKLPVTYLYPRGDTSCIEKENYEAPFPIYFDLNVDVLNKTIIKGRGLNSSWAGKVKITGSDQKPKFKGKLQSQEGTFEFAGRLFELRNGILDFNGRLGKDTTLNLTASHEINGYLISTNLKGPLLGPHLTFKSEPPESKRDIISLVLFGQKVDALNTFQGISLTYTLASLTGIYEGPDVIDKLRKGIGLDQLSLGSLMDSDKDYTTIQLGKYITRGVLVTLNRPISSDPAPFIITAYFRGGFQFQTYFDQQQISKLQVQWRLSY